MHRIVVLTLALLSLTLVAGPASGYQLTTVAEGLDNPFCITFLPGGDLLVTEKPGQLRRVSATGTVGQPIAGVPEVYYAGQGGLFDVLLDPNFETNRLIYLSYAHGNRSANATRIARAKLGEGALEDLEVIFTVTPTKNLPQHFGGKMIFLPDGTLMLTTGDGFNFREHAQITHKLLGKTVRINPDGSIPDDNPFADGVGGHPAVWSYGHRNPQGLILDERSGKVYLHEHGPRGGDEINLIEPGKNYGWPAITFGVDYSGAYVSPFTAHPGMEQPLKYWVPSIAPSGFALYDGDRFPQWQGSFLVGALVDREVRRVTLNANGTTSEEALFSELDERIRDVRVSPDGAVYLVTDGNPGSIVRVDPD
jgi:glucose/arabinose dehydrogenase